MKSIITLLAGLLLSIALMAQPGKKPAAKKPVAKKPATVKKTIPMKKVMRKSIDEMVSCYEDGGVCTIGIQPGDTLIYEVNAGGNTYEFWVMINKAKDGSMDFNWKMTDPVNKSGHVIITKEAMSGARKYINYFAGGKLVLTDACTVWMSYDTFGDMPQQKTEIILDNNAPETFVRPDDDVVAYTINYRGREIKLDAFQINNGKEGDERKEIHTLNTSANSLIVGMNLGWTIKLREVR
jgi:hypothetical protein